MKKILITLLLFVSLIVQAATYYVSNAGNNAANGTTTGTSWQTIAKVNGVSFSAGDVILFKRGDTWSETLVTSNSGTTGNVITYGAYGIGADPIITSMGVVTGSGTSGNWTNNGSNNWSMSLAPNFSSDWMFVRMWFNDVEKQAAFTSTVSAGTPWYWNEATEVLYVYSTSNPASAFTSIKTSHLREYSMTCGNEFVTISNLDLRGGRAALYLTGNHILVDGCKIGWDSNIIGLWIAPDAGDDLEVQNCIVDTGCTFYYDGDTHASSYEGIILRGDITGLLIHDNQLKNWGHACIGLNNPNAMTVTNVKIYNNYFTSPDIDYGRALNLELPTGSGAGIEVYNNIIYDFPTQSQFNLNGLKFYNNIVNTVRVTWRPRGHEGINMAGYDGSYDPRNIKIWNNVFANCEDAGLGIRQGSSAKTGIEVINNIFYENLGHLDYGWHVSMMIDNTAEISDNIFKNNLFYRTGYTDIIIYDGVNHTIAEFNAHNGNNGDVISGNLNGDPLFVDAAGGDFHLATNSPAIGAGIGVGLSTDASGVGWNATPSMGVYESTGGGGGGAGTTYYVAPATASPAGNDANPGTITQPFFTLNQAWSVAVAGDVIYMRGGTYNYTSAQNLLNKSGTSGSHILISNYQNEKPVLSFAGSSDHQAIRPSHVAYLDIVGLRLTHVHEHETGDIGTYGILCHDVTNSTFKRIEADYIGGWGFALEAAPSVCTDLLFENCDAHDNMTPNDGYGGGDGFQSGGSPSTTRITIRGCRFWFNCDDGIDLRVCDGLYTVENNWVFRNGYKEDHTTAGGNGMGIKLGGTSTAGASTSSVRRVVKNNLSFMNRYAGVDGSDDDGYVGYQVYNNIAYRNLEGMNFNYHSVATLNNNWSWLNNSTTDLTSEDNWRDNHSPSYNTDATNSWNGAVTITNADFVSIDTAGITGQRQADGSLPALDFLRLVSGSDLKDAGTDVGIAYNDAGPDIGAFEYGTSGGSVMMVTLDITAAGGATTISTYHGTLQMSVAGFTPANTTNTDVVWTVVPGTGSATINSSGLLTAATNGTVTVWAYAADGDGANDWWSVTLSNQVQAGYATVTTTSASNINETSAISGGNVTADGGSTVTDKGICWSVSSNPTIADTHAHAGTGTGSFASAITGLTKGITYHVRAFATNTTGTSYGADVSFTTRSFRIVVW